MPRYLMASCLDADQPHEDPVEPSEYLVGDLLWSRVPPYPYWPCMVTYHPLESIFKKNKTCGRKVFTVYHVQYFGKLAQRGWTLPNGILPFRGISKLQGYFQVKRREIYANFKGSKAARLKELLKYDIPENRKNAWYDALYEIDEANKYERSSRLETFVFKFQLPESRRNSLSNGNSSSSQSSNGSHSLNGVADDDSFEQSIGDSSSENGSSRAKTIEHLCLICEKVGVDVFCSGNCLQAFHADCLGMISVPKDFICDECQSDKHTCFSCKTYSGQTKKCSKANCGRYYHVDCLSKYRVADKDKFICPLHFCHNCFNDDPQRIQNTNCKFIECFRCPIAYHAKDTCVGAGSLEMTSSFLICPEHYVPVKRIKNVVNISWCANCGKTGDQLICCDSCPIAIHTACWKAQVPEGSFYCEECQSRKHFRYGVMVWVKLGTFRWWPARIIHPKNLPANILRLKHDVGQFPIQYYGTGEYYWIHKGHVFEYCVEDKPLAAHEIEDLDKLSSLSSMKLNYKRGLEESLVEFDKIVEAKRRRMSKKPNFKLAKVCRPVGDVKAIAAEPSAPCNCNPKDEFPCGYESSCLNRSMCYECHPSTCPAKEKCRNQMFAKREYPKIAPFETADRGWGLKALEDIKAGHFIIEYVGDLIDEKEFKKRIAQKHEANDSNYYFLTLDKDRIIDAGPRGNHSRYMNHSCSPNCETQKWNVNGDVRIGLFAKYEISAGTELTFDYNLDPLNNAKLKCLCGSSNCRGDIGEKPQNPRSLAIKDKKDKLVKKRKYSKKQVKEPNTNSAKIGLKASGPNKRCDDLCFICKEDGELVICSRKGCRKGYHVSCLQRNDIPEGLWQCPMHFCDICGHVSQLLCSKCPNSVCKEHKSNLKIVDANGMMVCSAHVEKKYLAPEQRVNGLRLF